MFDAEFTRSYYDAQGEAEWGRWDVSGHMRLLLDRYLREVAARVRSGDRVLETGPGSGRFTQALIELGAEVTAFDISPVQIELCKRNAPGAASYELGTVTDLSRFADESYDVVLGLGGVLSYCFDQSETAVAEMRRVLKPGGTLGVSVMNRLASIHHFLRGVLAINIEANQRIISSGHLTRDVGGHECYLFRVHELTALLADFDSVELTSVAWLTRRDDVDALPAPGTDEYEWLIEWERLAGLESPGAGTHILAWAQKPAGLTPKLS